MTVQREVPRPWSRPVTARRSAGPSAGAGSQLSRIRGWLHRRSVLVACVVTAGLHLLFLTGLPTPDEGGFAVLARHWNDPGPYLYGPQWVDRPPLLIWFFDMANHLGPYGTRIMATIAAVVLVAAVAWAAQVTAGPVAARWAAWTACAMACSAFLSSEVMNGEILAAPLVALAIAMALSAVRRHPAWILPAGLCAGSAVFVKQNFVDGIAFGLVLLVLTAVRERRIRHGLLLVGGFLAGVAVPAVVAVIWAQGRGGLPALTYAMYGFRVDAARVMSGWSTSAPQERFRQLLLLALASGQISLLVLLALGHVRRLRRLSPLAWAITAASTVEVVAILGGGNFWAHYLIGLIPMVALATGIAARHRQPVRRWIRPVAVFAVVVTLVVDPVWAAVQHSRNPTSGPVIVAHWVRDSAHAGDTLTVPFTHADVLDDSGLAPAYPFSWSLPVRARDPHLSILVSTLSGPQAPDWVVRWDAPHLWGLDPGDRVDAALHAHYREVAKICGRGVWLHAGLHRTLAQIPPTTKDNCHGMV